MGLWDLIFGGGKKVDDIDDEIDRGEGKTYGDLYAGGRGTSHHDFNEEDSPRTDPRLAGRTNRLSENLEDVERRAKALHIDDRRLEKTVGKIGRGIEKLGNSDNPGSVSVRNAALRKKIRSGYEKLEGEHEKRLEKLREDGASERRLKEEQLKMKRLRDDMSSMYRRSGGSGMLK